MSLSMDMMKMVMLREHRSSHDFATTVDKVRQQAIDAGWSIPFEFDLQEHYIEHGFEDMGRAVNLYLCNPQAGYDITRDDSFLPMMVMMPTAVAIYEDSGGNVRIGRMRLGTMGAMFGGVTKRALKGGEALMVRTLQDIVEK